MDHVWNSIIGGTFTPFNSFATSAVSRFYWVYVVLGLLIAWAVYYRRGGHRAFFGQLFRWDTWLSKSAQNDYAINIINPILLLLVSSWVFINGADLAEWTAGFLNGLGLGGEASLPWQAVLGLALTVSLFIVDDFIRWFGHYLHHRIPVLWEFHKVHHSAEVLNFATTDRFHPVEAVIMAGLFTISAGIVNGTFIALWGDALSVPTLAGANILWIGANVIGGVLRHSPFWVSFGPRVERWLISPAMHQIHHSNDPKHYDRNFGGTLAIWDRWFGTVYIPDGHEALTYGIGPETEKYRPLPAVYLRPFWMAGKLIIGWFQRGTSPTAEKRR